MVNQSTIWRRNNKEKDKIRRLKWYRKNREKILVNQRIWIKAHPEKIESNKKRLREWQRKPENMKNARIYSMNYRKNHKDQTNSASNRARIKYNYGITLEQFEQMKTSQDNKCAICGNTFLNSMDTCIDHNHINKKVRQLLCRKCNIRLGIIESNPLLFKKSLDYLLKWIQSEHL